jgi:hypothetical protein
MTLPSWIVTTYVCLSHRNTLEDSQKDLEKNWTKDRKRGLLTGTLGAHRTVWWHTGPSDPKDSNSGKTDSTSSVAVDNHCSQSSARTHSDVNYSEPASLSISWSWSTELYHPVADQTVSQLLNGHLQNQNCHVPGCYS